MNKIMNKIRGDYYNYFHLVEINQTKKLEIFNENELASLLLEYTNLLIIGLLKENNSNDTDALCLSTHKMVLHWIRRSNPELLKRYFLECNL